MSMHQLELDRHHELAAFLQSRRARIVPEQVGLPGGTQGTQLRLSATQLFDVQHKLFVHLYKHMLARSVKDNQKEHTL